MNAVEKVEFLERLISDKNNIKLFNKIFNMCGSIKITYCEEGEDKEATITCYDDHYLEIKYDNGTISGGYIEDDDMSYADMLRTSIVFLIQELIVL
jgi:hypothetical protein